MYIRVNKNEHHDYKPIKISYWSVSERHLWMLTLFLGCASLYSTRAIMPICSFSIQEEMHWTRINMGTVMGSFFWGYMTTQFLGGYLSDLFGGETILTLAAFGWASVTLSFPFLPHFFLNPDTLFLAFLCARMALGFFQGFHYPAVGSLMAHRVDPNERQFTYSFQGAGSHFGTLLCGSLGSILVENFGWRIPFFLLGIMGFFWTILTRQFLMSRKQRIIQYTFDVERVQVAMERDPIPWRKLLKHPAFWAMLAGHFAHSNSFVILLNWLPTYFHDNYPDARSWVFNVVPWVVTIPSVLFSGYLGDLMMRNNISPTFIRKSMNTVVQLGPAIMLILLTFSTGYLFSLVCMALAVAFCGFHSSGILLNPSDLAPKFGGAVFGITNMVGAVPGFLGVYLAGYVLELTKSWDMVFLLTAFVCIIGWIIYTLFGSAKRIV